MVRVAQSIRDLIVAKPHRDVVTAAPAESMRVAVERMVANNIGALVIVDQDRPIGILTERDVLRSAASGQEAFLAQPIAACMTANPVVGALDEAVEAVQQTMTDRRFRHLPVVDGGRLVAMISMGDVVRAQLSKVQAESRYLRDYIAGSYA